MAFIWTTDPTNSLRKEREKETGPESRKITGCLEARPGQGRALIASRILYAWLRVTYRSFTNLCVRVSSVTVRGTRASLLNVLREGTLIKHDIHCHANINIDVSLSEATVHKKTRDPFVTIRSSNSPITRDSAFEPFEILPTIHADSAMDRQKERVRFVCKSSLRVQTGDGS